ncbi:hypothetical protein [uncultured Parabacteroides sp.]|nr:hypothetical protein [uncultured Parabacteroides sp.]
MSCEAILRLLSGFCDSLNDDEAFRLFWKELGEGFISFADRDEN